MNEEIKTENTTGTENAVMDGVKEENTAGNAAIVHAKPEEVTVVQPKPVSTVKSIEQIREEETRREEEKGNRKREIIKNIAIIFLSVMLVLTFFSNTILNITLPQVSTEVITSGTIKSQIRGKGTIEAIDPYNITVKETRTVNSVDVKEGDTVKIGDVIYSLQGEESSELDSAKNDLTAAEIEFQKSVINNGLDPSQVMEIKSGSLGNLAAIQSTIAAFDAQIKSAETDVNTHTAAKNTYQAQLDALGTYQADQSGVNYWKNKEVEATYNKTVNSAERDKYKALEDAYNAAVSEGKEPTEEQKEGHANYVKWDNEVKANELAIAEAQKNQNQISNSLSDPDAQKRKDLTAAIANENLGIQLSEKAVSDAKARKEEYVKLMAGKMDAMTSYSKIVALQEKIDKMEKASLGSQITAPVAGKIVSLGKKSGEQTAPNEVVAVIQVEGKGYRTSITVDATQARTVKVGDIVNVDDYFMSDVQVNLVAINPDKTDPQNKKSLVFELNGEDLEPGGTISLSVGDSSSSYNLTVPKSALRKDVKGDFILILQEKSVPFGVRYVAKKVEVSKIYAQDDSRAAIQADVDEYGVYVITNSSKPISAGDQVRLSEEQK